MAGKDILLKVAMFVGGITALDLTLAHFVPSLETTISSYISKLTQSIPLDPNTLTMIIYGIYGVAGVYLIYRTFKK